MYGSSVIVFILCALINTVQSYPIKHNINNDDDIGFGSGEWSKIEKNPCTKFDTPIVYRRVIDCSGSGDGFSDDEDDDADEIGSGSGSKSIDTLPAPPHATSSYEKTTPNPFEFSGSGGGFLDDDDEDLDASSGSGTNALGLIKYPSRPHISSTHMPVVKINLDFAKTTQNPFEFSGSGDGFSVDDSDDDDSGSGSGSNAINRIKYPSQPHTSSTHIPVAKINLDFASTTQNSSEFSGSGDGFSDDEGDDDDSGSGSGSNAINRIKYHSQPHTSSTHKPAAKINLDLEKTTQNPFEFSGSGDEFSDDDSDDDDSGSGSGSNAINRIKYHSQPHTSSTHKPAAKINLDLEKTTQNPFEFSGSGDEFSDDDSDDDYSGSGSGSNAINRIQYPSRPYTSSTHMSVPKVNFDFAKTTENPFEFSGSGNGESDADDDDDANEGSGSGVHINVIESPPTQITLPLPLTSKSPEAEDVKQPSSIPTDFIFEDEIDYWRTHYKVAIDEDVKPVFYRLVTTAPKQTLAVVAESYSGSPNLLNKETRSNVYQRYKTFKLAHSVRH